MTFYFNMIMIQKHQKQISFYIKLQYKYKKDKGLIIFIQFMIFIQIKKLDIFYSMNQLYQSFGHQLYKIDFMLVQAQVIFIFVKLTRK